MGKIAEFLKSLRKKIKHAVGYVYEMVAGIVFWGFFVFILMQVFSRYVVHSPLHWTEEFSRVFYVAMIFLGSAVVMDEQFRFDLGINFVKKHSLLGYKILNLFIDIVVSIVLSYLVVGSYNRTVSGWTKVLPLTGIKVAYLYIPLLAGTALILICTLMDIGVNLFSLGQKKEVDGR